MRKRRPFARGALNRYSAVTVQRRVYEDFQSHFDSEGRFSCPCGQVHRLLTRSVITGKGALAQSADLLLKTRGAAPVLWVLSDENTEAAAGAAWKEGVKAARIVSRVLPARPRPEPSMHVIEELGREARNAAPDLLVSVGSGVISDLVKRVSFDLGIPNWCVATAASVDAFTSATSSVHVGGFHNAVPAAVSEAVICDLDVIARSPREMTLAGLGDLLAKFIAHLDWSLSRIVTGEHFCDVISTAALDSARKALAAARTLDQDPAQASGALADAVITSGFSMQVAGSSRSAASVEHMMAHFWEIADAVRNERLDLHGILVGTASRAVLRGYRAFYRAFPRMKVKRDERLKAFAAERPWQETLEPGLAPYRQKVSEEMERKKIDAATLQERLARLEESREKILQIAPPALDELAESVSVLESLDYPFSRGEIGLSEELFLLPVRNVRLLRARYSTFDLAWEMGQERVIYDEIRSHVLAGD